jgi:hypothetical protein
MRHSNVMFIASIVRPDNVTDVMPFWRGASVPLGGSTLAFVPRATPGRQARSTWRTRSFCFRNSTPDIPKSVFPILHRMP